MQGPYQKRLGHRRPKRDFRLPWTKVITAHKRSTTQISAGGEMPGGGNIHRKEEEGQRNSVLIKLKGQPSTNRPILGGAKLSPSDTKTENDEKLNYKGEINQRSRTQSKRGTFRVHLVRV